MLMETYFVNMLPIYLSCWMLLQKPKTHFFFWFCTDWSGLYYRYFVNPWFNPSNWVNNVEVWPSLMSLKWEVLLNCVTSWPDFTPGGRSSAGSHVHTSDSELKRAVKNQADKRPAASHERGTKEIKPFHFKESFYFIIKRVHLTIGRHQK